MTPETLQRMREAAEGARIGAHEWHQAEDEHIRDVFYHADAAHIALASPENVLALLDALDNSRDEADELALRLDSALAELEEARA